MDFHIPKVPHSWRELGKEIGIIVVGVLIALTAEQIVEDWQWHRKIHAAETAIRFELAVDDGPQMYQRVAMHPCLAARLDAIRSAIESGSDLGEIHRLAGSYWVDVRTFDTLALQAATTSDVASHMPQERLARITYPYARMALLNRANMDEGVQMSRLRAFRTAGGPLSNEEKDQLLRPVEALGNDDALISASSGMMLPSIREIEPLDPARVHSLVVDARAHYGDCIKDPD
jgi:hypothetical protein